MTDCECAIIWVTCPVCWRRRLGWNVGSDLRKCAECSLPLAEEIEDEQETRT